jgi:hypothetical protein
MSMRRPAGELLRIRRVRAMRKLGMMREVRAGILVVVWCGGVWVVVVSRFRWSWKRRLWRWKCRIVQMED